MKNNHNPPGDSVKIMSMVPLGGAAFGRFAVFSGYFLDDLVRFFRGLITAKIAVASPDRADT